MNYLEKVLNTRIEELKADNKRELNELKQKLNNNALESSLDIEECYLCIDANENRIDELEKLKIGLGLVPVEELKDSDD